MNAVNVAGGSGGFTKEQAAQKLEQFGLPASTHEGIVQSYSQMKGFGFIECEGESLRVFVHKSDVKGSPLQMADKVYFEVEKSPKDPDLFCAKNVVGGTGGTGGWQGKGKDSKDGKGKDGKGGKGDKDGKGWGYGPMMGGMDDGWGSSGMWNYMAMMSSMMKGPYGKGGKGWGKGWGGMDDGWGGKGCGKGCGKGWGGMGW